MHPRVGRSEPRAFACGLEARNAGMNSIPTQHFTDQTPSGTVSFQHLEPVLPAMQMLERGSLPTSLVTPSMGVIRTASRASVPRREPGDGRLFQSSNSGARNGKPCGPTQCANDRAQVIAGSRPNCHCEGVQGISAKSRSSSGLPCHDAFNAGGNARHGFGSQSRHTG